jgi:hypothetical protein
MDRALLPAFAYRFGGGVGRRDEPERQVESQFVQSFAVWIAPCSCKSFRFSKAGLALIVPESPGCCLCALNSSARWGMCKMRTTTWITPAVVTRGMKMTKYVLGATVLCAFCLFTALPPKVLADGIQIQWSGTLQTGASVAGSAIVAATQETAEGEYLVDSIVSGSQTISGLGTASLSLLPLYPAAGSYDFADNLIWPAGTSPGRGSSPADALVDNAGLSFSDGTYDYVIYAVNLAATPEYWECTTQDGSTCLGTTTDIAGPLTSLTITAVPEPTTGLLLGTGLLGFLMVMRKRIAQGLPQAS